MPTQRCQQGLRCQDLALTGTRVPAWLIAKGPRTTPETVGGAALASSPCSPAARGPVKQVPVMMILIQKDPPSSAHPGHCHGDAIIDKEVTSLG